MSSAQRPRLLATTPVFVVSDLQRSLDFYVGKLGFVEPAVWGEPPCFAMCNRDGFDLMLSLAPQPGAVHPNGPGDVWDLCLRVGDLATELAALHAHGVLVVKGPTDTFYAMREVEVLDPDGFRICIALDISNEPPAAGPEETWDAALDLDSKKLRLVLKLWHAGEGHAHAALDSPDQGATNLAVDRIERTATGLALQMTQIGASFVGTFTAERTLAGLWSQGGRTWPLVWTRR